VQAQAKEGFVFFRIHNELLEFVEDVAVEPVVGPMYVQCVLGRESCVDEQGQDLLVGAADSAAGTTTQASCCGNLPQLA
jgi:hypothetical protein